MSNFTCYQFISESIKQFGVEVVFGEVGIPVTQIAFELQKLGVQFISHRSEAPSTYAASCYGYLTSAKTNLPGFALTTGGPGLINALAGLSHATVNCWPLVLISGSADRKEVGKGSFQELNQIEIVKENKSICKGAFQICSIEEVHDVVYQAIVLAINGVPGGVYIDIPTDVLLQSIDITIARNKLQTQFPNRKRDVISVDEQKIAKTVKLLADAKSPLVVIGKGAAKSQCENELEEFIELSGIPFLPTPMGRGLVPDDHKLSVIAARSRALREADVVLLCGCRLNWILHFGEPPKWRSDVKFIVIDIDEDLAHSDKIHILLHGDIRLVLKPLLIHVRATKLSNSDSQQWIESITTASKAYRCGPRESSLPLVPGTMTYLQAFAIIKQELDKINTGSNITIVAEGSKTMDISRVALPVYRPRGRLDAGTWGTMGLGLGYAVAASIADPNPHHYVIALEGDSALGFSLAEVETLTRYNLPVIILVFNNGGVYSGASSSTANAPLPTQLSQETKYSMIMEAVGGLGHRATNTEELKAHLQSAIINRRPTLIDILIDPLNGESNIGIVTSIAMGGH